MNLLKKPDIERYISTIHIKIQPSIPFRKQIYQNQSWNLKLNIDLRCVLWVPIWDICSTQSYKKSQILQRYPGGQKPKNDLLFVWKILLFCNFAPSKWVQGWGWGWIRMKIMMKMMCLVSFCVCVGNTGQRRILWQSPHQKSNKAKYINWYNSRTIIFSFEKLAKWLLHIELCLCFLMFFTQPATSLDW